MVPAVSLRDCDWIRRVPEGVRRFQGSGLALDQSPAKQSPSLGAVSEAHCPACNETPARNLRLGLAASVSSCGAGLRGLPSPESDDFAARPADPRLTPPLESLTAWNRVTAVKCRNWPIDRNSLEMTALPESAGYQGRKARHSPTAIDSHVALSRIVRHRFVTGQRAAHGDRRLHRQNPSVSARSRVQQRAG